MHDVSWPTGSGIRLLLPNRIHEPRLSGIPGRGLGSASGKADKEGILGKPAVTLIMVSSARRNVMLSPQLMCRWLGWRAWGSQARSHGGPTLAGFLLGDAVCIRWCSGYARFLRPGLSSLRGRAGLLDWCLFALSWRAASSINLRYQAHITGNRWPFFWIRQMPLVVMAVQRSLGLVKRYEERER